MPITSDDLLSLGVHQDASVTEIDNEGTISTKIASLAVIAYQGVGSNSEFGGNIILQDKAWTVIVIHPNEFLEEGDRFTLTTGQKLDIKSINPVDSPEFGKLMWAICEQIP